MSTPFLSIELKGAESLEVKVAALENLDVRELLDHSAAICLDAIRFRFLHTQEDSEGVPWVQSQAAKDRKASGRDGTTLFDTGKLFRSIQLFASDENTRAIGANAENAKGVQYGKFAQYGTVRLPKREFLGFANKEIGAVEEYIKMMVDKSLGH